jgi:hypothetical protein
MNDCWQVLGIAATTDADRVKRAYRALIKRYHPDTIPLASPEMIRQYTLRCGRINQAFRQAMERCVTAPRPNRQTAGPDHEESWPRERWEGAARRATGWRSPERPAAQPSRFAEIQEGGPASIVVTYLAPLLVIGSPLLLLCFGNMLWQMLHLLSSGQ